MYYVSGRWTRLKAFPGSAFRHIIRTRGLRGLPSLVGELRPTNPTHVTMMADMIVLMSDIQTLSGIALMIAALSQLSSLTAYHAVQVANIGWMTSQAHQLLFIYASDPKLRMRHRRVRLAGIAMYGMLYTIYCACTYANLRRRWNLETYCFRACTASYCSGGYSDRDAMLGWVIATMSLFVSGYLPVMLSGIRGCTWFRPEVKYGWSELIRDIVFNLWMWQLVTCAWIIVTLNGVCQYRLANKSLLNDRDAEEKWGFGQVIAVASLLVVGFEFWTTFVGK